MSTPRAKRALNMGTTPASKRTKTLTRMSNRRAIGKPEVKHAEYAVSHASTTGSNIDLTAIASGAARGQRIGSKVKFLFVEMWLSAVDPIRVDIAIPSITNTAPSYAVTTFIDPDDAQVLFSAHYNPTDPGNRSDLVYWKHSFPLGIVSKWDSTTAASIQKHQMYLRITSPQATTVTGGVRIWYTDV